MTPLDLIRLAVEMRKAQIAVEIHPKYSVARTFRKRSAETRFDAAAAEYLASVEKKDD